MTTVSTTAGAGTILITIGLTTIRGIITMAVIPLTTTTTTMTRTTVTTTVTAIISGRRLATATTVANFPTALTATWLAAVMATGRPTTTTPLPRHRHPSTNATTTSQEEQPVQEVLSTIQATTAQPLQPRSPQALRQLREPARKPTV